MSIILKINCSLAKKIIIVTSWFILSGLPLYGVYVQEWTLSTFDKTGDCHTGYFTGNITCVSKNNLNDPNAFYSYSKGEIRSFEYGFIMVEIFGQLGLFLALNYSRGWIKIECTNDRQSNREVKQ